MNHVITPISTDIINQLIIGDCVSLSGRIYAGRDAVLPRIVEMIQQGTLLRHYPSINLEGAVIFHTAVSIAGVGPTSSNKYDIENSMEVLSSAGVKMYIGKGELHRSTIAMLGEMNSVFAVIPPVTALLKARTRSSRVVEFSELGMEAFYELEVENYPLIIAAAHGRSIYG